MKILFVWPNKDSFGYKHIGLSLLAGIARELGFEIKLFDTTEIDFGCQGITAVAESIKMYKPVDSISHNLTKKKISLRQNLQRILEEFKPDCLALTVTSDVYDIASEISKISKEIFPKLPIIWGGKHPTLKPEEILRFHNADFACVGEGFDAFSNFLEAMLGKRDPYTIPNLWAKKNGLIIKNKIAPLINNLDSLPYVNWEMFDRRQFLKPFDGNIYIAGDHMLNWGCPYNCTYCINHFYHEMYENKYFMRRYGVQRIIEELKFLKNKYKLEFFKFHDEDFLMRPIENMRELSEAYKQEVNLPFSIETNAKSVTKEKVELLKNMNCASASVAIEAGDPKIRKLLRRVDTEEEIIRAFSLFNEMGIRTSCFIMFGLPFETEETYKKTIELTRKANVQYPAAGFFYPFEGTKLREISIREGFFDPPEDVENMVNFRERPALKFKGFSEKELIEMRNVFILFVKLPKEYEIYIKRSILQDELGIKIRKKLFDIYEKTTFSNNGWYNDDGCMGEYIRELHEVCELKR